MRIGGREHDHVVAAKSHDGDCVGEVAVARDEHDGGGCRVVNRPCKHVDCEG